MAEKLTVTKGDKLQRIGFDPKIPEFLPMWVKANGGTCSTTTARPPT